MSNTVKLTTNQGEVILASDAEVVREDGQTVTVSELQVGDKIEVTRNMAIFREEILEISPVEQEVSEEEREASQEERIEALQARVTQLEETLVATNDALMAVNRTLVELTADHMQRLFNDPVMVDSIAQRMFIAGANAIAHKAKTSKQRAPELVVVEGYVPGSVRVTVTDNGVIVEEQDKATQQWVSGEALSEGMRDAKIQHVMGDLVVSYGGVNDRPYYVIDSVALEEFRQETSKKAMEVTAATGANGESGVEPAAE
jgi:uncharacterized coiled-coil protein SlyX